MMAGERDDDVQPDAESTVEPDGSSDNAEFEGTEPDLDELLREWDDEMSGVQPEASEPPDQGEHDNPDAAASTDPRVDEIYQWALAEQDRRDAEDAERELANAVARAREEMTDLSIQPSDEMTSAYLERLYRIDPKFRRAFDNRHTDRATWDRRLGKAIEGYRKHVEESVPDSAATADRAAVTSAMYAARHAGYEAPDQPMTEAEIKQMSDREFNSLRRSILSSR